jgi:Uma2 family endonuclease
MRIFAVTELMRLHEKKKMYTEKIKVVVRFDSSENSEFYGIHEVTTDGSYDDVQRAANKIINDNFKIGTVLTSHWEYV